MSTFFQQGLQQGINLYNQAAQRARQAELDAINKTRIEVLNKATEMQIKQAESAMELSELNADRVKMEMEEREREMGYAKAVDKFWSARRFDHTAENADAELDAIIQNPPEGVPINNQYWRKTIQNERAKINDAKEVQYTNKAFDIVSKLKTDVDSVFGIGGDLSTEEASSMLSRLSGAMANRYVMKTPDAFKSIATIAEILSNHVRREFEGKGMFNERIAKLGSEISNTARQLNEALEDRLDPSLAQELHDHLSLLISERQKLMDLPEPEPDPDPKLGQETTVFDPQQRPASEEKRTSMNLGTNAPRLNLPGTVSLSIGPAMDIVNQGLGLAPYPDGGVIIKKAPKRKRSNRRRKD